MFEISNLFVAERYITCQGSAEVYSHMITVFDHCRALRTVRRTVLLYMVTDSEQGVFWVTYMELAENWRLDTDSMEDAIPWVSGSKTL